jgi:LPPG:FO 2-phospho-L-lactate transferase
MSDEPVPTIVHTTEGDLSFQEYFVRERCEPTVTRLTHDGAAAAIPAPGTLESIAAADLIIVCPSNPLISIGPILAVGGIRRALRASAAPVVGISPIIAGQAVKGPTISLMTQLGHEPSAAGVAALYSDFMDAIVLDDADGALVARVRSSGVDAHLAPTLMDTPESRRRLAARVLEVAECRM